MNSSAVRIGLRWEKKSILRGKQKTDEPRMSEFLRIAEGLGLGTAAREKIKVREA